MSLAILCTPAAAADVEALHAWIALDSPLHADRFVDRLHDTLLRLALYPRSGRSWRTRSQRLRGIRVVAVANFPNHLVFCRADAEALLFVAALHAARDLPRVLRGRRSQG